MTADPFLFCRDKQLIATDFDGTFNQNGVIDPADLSAVAAWRAAGRKFGFVTGRGVDFLETAQKCGVEADFFLVYTGALLILPDTTVCKEYLIGRDIFAGLTAFFRGLPDARAFSEPDKRLFYHQYYATMPTQERALAVAEKMAPLFGDELAIFVNGEHINICKKGAGKAQGVFDALEYYGLPRDGALVFGDDYNDMEMLAAHNGFAVETARPAVLKAAPHVCKNLAEVIHLAMQ